MNVATSEEIAFIDRVLESWAAWARNACVPQCSHPSARYSSGRDVLPSVLKLTDDEFGRVDHAVAKLTAERRVIVRTHYCASENEPRRRKAIKCGISVREYSAVLLQAQLDVLDSIGPCVYDWQVL